MTRFFSALLGAVALVSSASAQAPSTPIRIAATSLAVEFQNPPPADYPHVGHRAPVPYEQAVRTWAESSFVLTGGSPATLRVTVREADIVEKLLPVKKGIAGWFRKDQAAEYAARLDVAVAIVDANGQQMGSAEAKSMFSTTMTEGATDADKRATWDDMVRRTIGTLDRELQPRLRSTLTRYVE